MQAPLRTLLSLMTTLALLGGCGGGGGDAPPQAGTPDAGAATTSFVAVGSSASTVSLGWKPVAGASGYVVERKSGTAAYASIATLDADADHFVDAGLDRNTAYSYRLRANGAAVEVEQTATTVEEAAVISAAGTPVGALVASTFGAAGGRLESADGTVAVEVPAGALAADTSVSLQAITNTAPGGQDDGVHLRVDGALAKPLTLTLKYAPEMAAHADGLGVAVQGADGSWLSLPVQNIDKTARSVSVRLPARGPAVAGTALARAQRAAAPAAASVSMDFHVIRFLSFYLSPREATVELGKTRVLVPYAHTKGVIGHICLPDDAIGCLPMPLLGTQEIPFENQKAGFTRKWYVFAEEGGNAALGTVTPRANVGATYKAPAQLPDPNPVWVSFVSVNDKTGRSVTLSSKITIKEPVWTGIVRGSLSADGGDIAFTFSSQAVWTLDGGDGTRFSANGTQTVSVVNITCSGVASPGSIELPPGALVIDRSVNPARYSLDVGSIWRTTITATCPGHGTASVPMDVPGRLVIEGTLNGDGSTIEGTAVQNGVSWDWALTSQL
jgi:hypothetical protein